MDAVNIAFGDQVASEQRLLCHTEIAFQIIRRDISLIAKKNLHAIPIDVPAFALSEQFIETSGSRAARKSDGAGRLLLQTLHKDASNFECCGEEEVAGGRVDLKSSPGLDLAIDRLRWL